MVEYIVYRKAAAAAAVVEWKKSTLYKFLGGKENGEKRAALAKSEPELPLNPTNQIQMTPDLKVDTGLPWKM